MTEMTIASQLNSEYVVKYYDYWIEDKNKVFIQMEFCSYNLKYLIDLKEKAFHMNNNNRIINSIDYFISTELLKELIEALNYLHTYKPPIIHRDIKPENILISNNSNNPNNSRFLKICDFGLIAFQETQSQSHRTGAGTAGFIAPDSGKSGTKADVYSLGVVAQHLLYTNV